LSNSLEVRFLTIGKGSKKGKEGKNNKKTILLFLPSLPFLFPASSPEGFPAQCI
jgi:hypothetical protein